MTHHFITGVAVAALLLLTACGGGDAAGGGKVNAKTFAAACEESSNMPPELCACIADKAMTELSPEGREFVVAGLRQDDDRTAELRSKMEISELTAAGTFMVNAPASCAREMSAG